MTIGKLTFEKKEIVYALNEDEAREKVKNIYLNKKNVVINSVTTIQLDDKAYIVSFSYEE